MKKLLSTCFSALFVLAIFTAVTYTACKPDKCKDVSCANGGSCNNGKCTCPDGYSGTQCEIKDPCKDIACLNGGTCNDGKCDCPGGYWGDSCQYEPRARYYKTYAGEGTDNLNQKYPGYRLRISAGGSDISLLKLELWNGPNPDTTQVLTFQATLHSDGRYELQPMATKDSVTVYTGSGQLAPQNASLIIHAESKVPPYQKATITWPNMIAQ